MAKISDLVKTYRMLSDPNAPDWNVKFVGAIAIAALVVAASAGALYWGARDDAAPRAPSAAVQDGATDEACAPPSPSAPAIPTNAPTPCSPAALP